ncbi:MAG: DUF3244 domain-containing protein [Bacteroidales bacterium]|nr:DUF3244 domain-containing protein [Bacteroidales bacterium]
MEHKKLKIFVLLVGLLVPTIRGGASYIFSFDGYSHIVIKEGSVHSDPKGSSIQASIDGHMLSVVFLENLGSVLVEVTDTNGGTVDVVDMYTPNGYTAYIFGTGSYIVNFTFENGDEYYGEFEVTN